MNQLSFAIDAIEFAETLLPGLPIDDAEALAGALFAHHRALNTLAPPDLCDHDGDVYVTVDHGIRPLTRIIAALTFAEAQIAEVLASWPLSVTGRRIVAGARFGAESVRFHVEASAPEDMPVSRFAVVEGGV